MSAGLRLAAVRLGSLLLGLVACAPPLPPHVEQFDKSAAPGTVPVVAFVDFECPYCKIAHARLEEAAKSTGATLAIDYREVPLRSHEHATEAAAAHVCAAEQGRGPEAVHALLATGAEGHDIDHLLAMAQRLELHEGRFTTCLNAASTRERLASDRRMFIEAQLDGVPVFFVDGEKLDGTRSLDEYVRAVSRAQSQHGEHARKK